MFGIIEVHTKQLQKDSSPVRPYIMILRAKTPGRDQPPGEPAVNTITNTKEESRARTHAFERRVSLLQRNRNGVPLADDFTASGNSAARKLTGVS